MTPPSDDADRLAAKILHEPQIGGRPTSFKATFAYWDHGSDTAVYVISAGPYAGRQVSVRTTIELPGRQPRDQR